MSKESVLVYHHNDADGKMSAAIIKQTYPQAECEEMDYGFNYAEFRKREWYNPEKFYDYIFVVDFSFDEKIMKHLISKAKKEFIWIDHHKSAMENNPELWNSDSIGGLREIGKAGCMLTWEWFVPYEKAPDAIKYVQEYDIWDFKTPLDSKPFAEAVQYYNVDDFLTLLNHPENVENVILRGKWLYSGKLNRVKDHLKKAVLISFEGKKVRIVNATNDLSLLGNTMCREFDDCDYSITYSIQYDIAKNPLVYMSLRSIGDMDVSEIAKAHGGGGHKNASGFKITLKALNSLLEEE